MGLKFENGKLIGDVSVGIDSDKDGIQSVALVASIQVDAEEAISEVFKSEPQWLKDLLAKLGV